MSFLVPARKVAALAAAGTGLASVVVGMVAPVAQAATSPSSSSATSGWFVDPLTSAERRAEIAVPKDPRAHAGKLRETRAAYRTRSGDLAVPVAMAFGNTMEVGQAVTLDREGLFVLKKGTVTLTRTSRAELGRLTRSLGDAAKVRCEGYSDYSGRDARSRVLAAGRATAVCDLLGELAPGLETRTSSYGPTHPVVVGGTPEKRDMNRRVVVEVLSARASAPQPLHQVPGAPTLTAAAGGLGFVHYDVAAPSSDGGTPVTGYEVDAGDGWKPAVLDGTRGILAGVPGGVSIQLRVRAVNAVGAGAPSNSLSATAYAIPGAPSRLEVVGGDTTLSVRFAAPETDGGAPVLGYEISRDNGSWSPVDPADVASGLVLRGLDNGTVHQVAVRAHNQWGPGAPVAGSALVATVPDAPWLENAVETVGTTATLTVLSPLLDDGTDGGAAITGYELTFDGGLTWVTRPVLQVAPGTYEITLTDLVLGDLYKVAVRAVNERGAGAASKTRSFTPADVPAAPSHVLPSVVGSDVTLTFDAPSFDGGAEITGYEVQVDDGAWAALELSSPGTTTLAGQTSGTHVYSVRALNRIGHSAAASSPTVEVVALQPLAPTILNRGYYGAGQQWAVQLTPGDARGAAVTGYQVSVEGGPWRDSAAVLDTGGYKQAMFDCPSLACGWTYSSAIRLRAVTSSGFSEPSATFSRPDFP